MRMEKIKKLIKGIGLIIKNPWLINLVIDDNNNWKKYISKKYKIDNGLPILNIDAFISEKKASISTFAFLDGGSSPLDLVLLKTLAAQIENCSYFEIGTWRGESVANVAEVAKECVSLNLSDQEMKEMKLSQKYIDLHGYFSKKQRNVKHLKGNSKTYDFNGLEKKFDLIFIDGDHHYEMVKNDTEKIYESLMKENTIIVWHDYAANVEHIRYAVFAGILDGLPKEAHKNLYQVSNTQCAIYIKKEFPSSSKSYPETPNKKFKVEVQF